MNTPTLALSIGQWLDLFVHFLSFSLLAVGGAITTVPEMHRYLVDQQLWLSDAQFNASIAIAQAAPGPNVLFVALMGWNVGLNAGGVSLALVGAFLCLSGMLLPSTVLAYLSARWLHHHRHKRSVRAFKQGLGPLVAAMLITTGWLLVSRLDTTGGWHLYVLCAVSTLIILRYKIHLLWLLGSGALLGGLGLV